VTELPRKKLNIVRRIYWSLLCALGGALTAVTLAIVFIRIQWILVRSNEFERQNDLKWLVADMVDPVLGCAVVSACAGWLAFAPVRSRSSAFLRSLAAVFMGSVLLGFIMKAVWPMPQQYKNYDPQAYFPFTWAVIIGSPIIVTTFLTWIQSRSIARYSPPW